MCRIEGFERAISDSQMLGMREQPTAQWGGTFIESLPPKDNRAMPLLLSSARHDSRVKNETA